MKQAQRNSIESRVCKICLKEFKDTENEYYTINPCNHELCKNCYLEILKNDELCVQCSSKLDDFKLEDTPRRIESGNFRKDNILFSYSYILGTQLSTNRKLKLYKLRKFNRD